MQNPRETNQRGHDRSDDDDDDDDDNGGWERKECQRSIELQC